MPLLEQSTKEEALAPGESLAMTVDSVRADQIIMLVDNGTTDGPPDQYDLVQRGRVGPAGRFQRYQAITGSTASSRIDQAVGTDFQAELTNSGANTVTYHVTLESRRRG